MTLILARHFFDDDTEARLAARLRSWRPGADLRGSIGNGGEFVRAQLVPNHRNARIRARLLHIVAASRAKVHSVRCSARAGAAQSEAYLIRRLLANDLALLLAAGLGGCTYPASSSSLGSSSESSRLQAPERSEARVAERAGWEGGRRRGWGRLGSRACCASWPPSPCYSACCGRAAPAPVDEHVGTAHQGDTGGSGRGGGASGAD